LNADEIAFYDALANNESAVRQLGDEVLKKIAIEITGKLRASTTVDWQVRDSVRAKLKILVRRTLQRWKYPPDKAAEAIELVMKQAEILSNAWSTYPPTCDEIEAQPGAGAGGEGRPERKMHAGAKPVGSVLESGVFAPPLEIIAQHADQPPIL
jgi:hypothetical protein